MAFGKTVTLFSEIHGRLVNADGTPQAGVTVKQWWSEERGDAGESTEAVTDAEGRFHFPAVERQRFWAAILPSTPAVKQKITVERPDKTLTLWQFVKTSHSPLSETGGRKLDLVCRIDAEEDGNGPAWGTCRFADDG